MKTNSAKCVELDIEYGGAGLNNHHDRKDVLTGEIVDHFGGQEDLKRGIVSHVNDASFAEDPLRVLRAAQFAARFGFSVAEETLSLCARMDLTNLAGERILVEASPYDGIWGVKLGIEDPKIQNPNN